MSVFVKICGLAREQDVVATAALDPDALGFVFYAGSPRGVRACDVAAWTKGLSSGVLKVGVFVDFSPEEIQAVVLEAGLDVVQFHGAYRAGDMGRVEALRWRVLHDGVLPEPLVCSVSDAFLLDSAAAGALGGTGLVGDWGVAKAFVRSTEKAVWLAGGLTPDNVVEAIGVVAPLGVDVSSGVEVHPGVKDMDKVKQFIERSRNA